MRSHSRLLLAALALAGCIAAASAQDAATAGQPGDKKNPDPYYDKCNARKYAQGKKNTLSQHVPFCCATWAYMKKKSQTNCNRIFDFYGALVNETLANYNFPTNNIPSGVPSDGQDGKNGASVVDVKPDPNNPDLLIFYLSDNTTITANMSGLIDGANGVEDFKLDGEKILLYTSNRNVPYEADLSDLLEKAAEEAAAAAADAIKDAIKDVSVNAADPTKITVTTVGNDTREIDLSSLFTDTGVSSVEYDKTTGDLTVILNDGTNRSTSLAALMSTANGVENFSLDYNSKVLTLDTVNQDYSILLGPLFAGTITDVIVEGNNVTFVFGDGNVTTIDLSKILGKGITDLKLNADGVTLNWTYLDGSTGSTSLAGLLAKNGLADSGSVVNDEGTLLLARQDMGPVSIDLGPLLDVFKTRLAAVKNVTLVSGNKLYVEYVDGSDAQTIPLPSGAPGIDNIVLDPTKTGLIINYVGGGILLVPMTGFLAANGIVSAEFNSTYLTIKTLNDGDVTASLAALFAAIPNNLQAVKNVTLSGKVITVSYVDGSADQLITLPDDFDAPAIDGIEVDPSQKDQLKVHLTNGTDAYVSLSGLLAANGISGVTTSGTTITIQRYGMVDIGPIDLSAGCSGGGGGGEVKDFKYVNNTGSPDQLQITTKDDHKYNVSVDDICTTCGDQGATIKFGSVMIKPGNWAPTTKDGATISRGNSTAICDNGWYLLALSCSCETFDGRFDSASNAKTGVLGFKPKRDGWAECGQAGTYDCNSAMCIGNDLCSGVLSPPSGLGVKVYATCAKFA